MKEYLLVRRGSREAWNKMAETEHRATMRKLTQFVTDLTKERNVRDGSNLLNGVSIKAGSNGIIIDGPFMETKETLLGYIVFSAADIDDAIAASKRCPALAIGESLELFALN